MATKKIEPMCAVDIGYQTYLMPATAGMKLVQLLTQAVECDKDYEDGGYVYTAGDQVSVSYRNVRSAQIRMPAGKTEPVPRRLPRLALEHDE